MSQTISGERNANKLSEGPDQGGEKAEIGGRELSVFFHGLERKPKDNPVDKKEKRETIREGRRSLRGGSSRKKFMKQKQGR